MGLFDIFKRKPKENIGEGGGELAKSQRHDVDMPPIHQDLTGLLWINNNQDYQTRENKTLEIDDFISLSISFNEEVEPSLIDLSLPVREPSAVVERPPYYPSYSNLTSEQRWVYLNFLKNPYDTDIDIGYVFILYYGLERHLLQGDFYSAYKIILKLRDVHSNKSFQNYTANALILTAMLHNHGEEVIEFVKSLDKEYEFNFSDNLFLICYYSFNLPLYPKDIMRMAKTFEFANNNYIKKYPDIFELNMKEVIKKEYKDDKVFLDKILTKTELKKIRYQDVSIFANVSIIDKTIPIPMLPDNFRLKKEMNSVLELAHEKTKVAISKSRKDGTLIEAAGQPKPEKKAGYPVNPEIDVSLLKDPPADMPIRKKFSFYNELIYDLYKDREKPGVLGAVIELCKRQIALSPEMLSLFARAKTEYEAKKERHEEIKRLFHSVSMDQAYENFLSNSREDREVILRARYEQGEYDKKTFKKLLDEIKNTPIVDHGVREKLALRDEVRELDDLQYEGEGAIHYRHNGFYHLCVILEKQKNYQDLYRYASLAQEEGWVGDWDKRIERAKKKLAQ
jgi:hypothetical protein